MDYISDPYSCDAEFHNADGVQMFALYFPIPQFADPA
jgi:hypothetical protein